jgi:hypothetical protein
MDVQELVGASIGLFDCRGLLDLVIGRRFLATI